MIKAALSCCIVALLLVSSRAFAQNNFGKVWVQGESIVYLTTFNGPGVIPINDTIDTRDVLYFAYGHSGICDTVGNPLIICDGYNIYYKHLNFLDGGDTIVPKLIYIDQGGWSNYTQSSIILPFANNKFRVITPTISDSGAIRYWLNPASDTALFDELLYDEIDMNANSGSGKVTKKMIPLLQKVKLSKTQMMACKHGDGKSWWLLKQALDTNVIYKFLLTQDSIYGPYIQGFSEPHFTKWDICGQAMFSKDGTKYATAVQNTHKIFLADFDRCSGSLSNPKVIDVPTGLFNNPYFNNDADSSTCGLCFSPNGSHLYVNGFWSVQQLDLLDSNASTKWITLSGPDTTWAEFQQYSNIYPGPDGKLYVGNWNGLGGQMSIINNPNIKGLGADFCSKCLRFPGRYFQGIVRHFGVSAPPCMPNYELGPSTPACTLGVEQIVRETQFLLFPNPSQGMVTIKYEEAGTVKFYDITGRVVKEFALPARSVTIQVNFTDLPKGLYQYKYISNDSHVNLGKLILL